MSPKSPFLKAWSPADGTVGRWWGLCGESQSLWPSLEGYIVTLLLPLPLSLLPGCHKVISCVLYHTPPPGCSTSPQEQSDGDKGHKLKPLKP